MQTCKKSALILLIAVAGLTALSGCEKVDLARANETALLALRRGDTDNAVQILRETLTKAPDATILWRNLATAYQQQHNPARALDALRKAYDLDPNSAALRRELARLEFEQGHWENVSQLYSHPGVVRDSTEDYLYPALAAQRQQRLEGALTILDHGLQLFPHNYALLMASASACADRGKLQQALTYARQARKLTTSPAPNILIANIELAQGDADALQQSLAALERMPTQNPTERILLGQLYLELGRYASAGNEFRWALDAAPDSTDARLGMAIAMYHEGRYNEVLALCDELQQQNKDRDPRLLSGYVYAARRQYSKAIENLEAALAEDPAQPAVQALLAQLRNPNASKTR